MYPSTEQITKRSAEEEEEEEEERRGHSPLSLGREATKPRLSGYRGHIVRARTRGARGGESTARLAPSRQLEHSRPLRVLRARPFLPSFVRSLPPRYHLLFFSSSPRSRSTACLRPFFHLALLPRPPSLPPPPPRDVGESSEPRGKERDSIPFSFFSFFPLLRSMCKEREIYILIV